MPGISIREFQQEDEAQVGDLITDIQINEFGVSITREEQTDLRAIADYYQTGCGNFWVALNEQQVVGTLALLDIGDGMAALRKMFVHSDFRGSKHGASHGLLKTLLEWARMKGVEKIFLGTTSKFLAAQRFYEKHGFTRVEKQTLPERFPIMAVDSVFFEYSL